MPEDEQHVLLHCPKFHWSRKGLFQSVSELIDFDLELFDLNHQIKKLMASKNVEICERVVYFIQSIFNRNLRSVSDDFFRI